MFSQDLITEVDCTTRDLESISEHLQLLIVNLREFGRLVWIRETIVATGLPFRDRCVLILLCDLQDLLSRNARLILMQAIDKPRPNLQFELSATRFPSIKKSAPYVC